MKYILFIFVILSLIALNCSKKIPDWAIEENRKADSARSACGCMCATGNRGWWSYGGGSEVANESDYRYYTRIECAYVTQCEPGWDILCMVRGEPDVYGYLDLRTVTQRRYTKR